jgi:ribose-phosphate pyrophosphokinase
MIPGFTDFMLLTGNSNPIFATNVARYLHLQVGKAEVSRFSDGEINVEIKENIRGRDVFIIQSTSHPANDNLLELMIMADACKRASAGRITAVIPYYGYARQDRKVASRAPITAKLIADILTTSGISRVLTMELHAGQIQGFFNVPVDNLYSIPLFTREILREKERLIKQEPENEQKLIVVSPDAGGVERARAYADRLGCGLAIVDKKRNAPNQSEVMHLIGDVEGYTAVLVDDLVDTAGTLTKAAKATKSHGATRVMAVCTHGVLSGPAHSRIENSVIEKLFVTDTIPLENNLVEKETQISSKIHVVSVASLFAEAIDAIHSNKSITRLFE